MYGRCEIKVTASASDENGNFIFAGITNSNNMMLYSTSHPEDNYIGVPYCDDGYSGFVMRTDWSNDPLTGWRKTISRNETGSDIKTINSVKLIVDD